MKKQQPPIWADKILAWFCSDVYLEEIIGDLHEWYYLRVKRQGQFKAKLFYFIDVVRFFRSYRLKSFNEHLQNSNNTDMLKNHLIIAWRTLFKQKAFSIINVLGLTLGMTAFLLIMIYANYELSFDQFHTNKDNIYRIQQNRYNQGKLTTQWAAGCAAIGPVLKAKYPEVKEFVTMTPDNALLTYGDKMFKVENALYTMNSFLSVFSIPLIKGDTSALQQPNTMAMSATTAKKFFGKADPIGKTLRHDGVRDFTVTAVFEDIPKNSHLNADVLFSFATYINIVGDDVNTAWDWDGFYSYIVLDPNSDYKDFERKIEHIAEVEREDYQSAFGQEFKLQPLTDIHLTSDYMMEMKANGSQQSTYFLIIIAIFIILIAWVNYINLATAKSLDRAKEVGIRKVMGSQKGQLVTQFLSESFILNLLAVGLALLLVYLLMPYFNWLAGRELIIPFTQAYFWFIILGLLFIGGFFSGIYPAFLLSNYNPVVVLKGKMMGSAKGQYLRKGLVTFQFIASLVLLIGTFTVYQQLNYMQDQKLGVEIEQTLVVKGPNITDSLYSSNVNLFKQSLSNQSSINSITASSAVPGSQPGWNAGGIRLLEQSEEEANQYRVIAMDGDFIDQFGLEMLVGRKFDDSRSNERENVIFNESAIDLIGFKNMKDALTQRVYFWGDTFNIVGVVKNYHQESLKKSFEPLIFRYSNESRSFYSAKVNSNNIASTIDIIEREYKATFPGNPFDFFFLDQHFEQQYKSEIQFGQIFGLFALLAIIIACLGLIGLASYMTIQRNKEIGIRKVLGASISSILRLLSLDFTKLIILAALLAIPLSWFIMHNWLASFAYRIDLSWYIFLLPALILFGIALISISMHTLKAATKNPVNSLRDD